MNVTKIDTNLATLHIFPRNGDWPPFCLIVYLQTGWATMLICHMPVCPYTLSNNRSNMQVQQECPSSFGRVEAWVWAPSSSKRRHWAHKLVLTKRWCQEQEWGEVEGAQKQRGRSFPFLHFWPESLISRITQGTSLLVFWHNCLTV